MPNSKWTVCSNPAHHPSHPGTKGTPLDIKDTIFRAKSTVTFLVIIISPIHRYIPYNGE